MSGCNLIAHLIRPQENHDDIPLLPPGGCTTSHLVSKIIIAASRCVKKYFVVFGGVLSGTYCRSKKKNSHPETGRELIRLAI
jgi:hypothetical protein